jgi:hypothetical protein
MGFAALQSPAGTELVEVSSVEGGLSGVFYHCKRIFDG